MFYIFWPIVSLVVLFLLFPVNLYLACAVSGIVLVAGILIYATYFDPEHKFEGFDDND